MAKKIAGSNGCSCTPFALAEEFEAQRMGAEQQAWLDRLEAEHDNLRSSLAWSATTGASVDRL